MNNLESLQTTTNNINYSVFSMLANHISLIFILVLILIIWSLIWKGIALYKSARNGSKVWFIIFLILNTLGILEIIYIFLVSKRNKNTNKPENLNQNN